MSFTRWIHAYEPSASERQLAPRTSEALQRLATERGLGERLAIHGGRLGGADVVVASPRTRADALLIVEVPPEYPVLQEACAIRSPDSAVNASKETIFVDRVQPQPKGDLTATKGR